MEEQAKGCLSQVCQTPTTSRDWLAAPYYFPPGPQPRKGRNYDDETLHYITPYKKADIMTNILVERYYQVVGRIPPTVIDLTACIGGNTLSFARDRRIRHVIAYERHNPWFMFLMNNITAYSLGDRVTPINDDGTTVSRVQYQNSIIFMDPPWNDTDANGNLLLGNRIVEAYVDELLRPGGAAVVAVKTPPKYMFYRNDNIIYHIENPDSTRRRQAKIWMHVFLNPYLEPESDILEEMDRETLLLPLGYSSFRQMEEGYDSVGF